MRKVVTAAAVGNIIEWYDFYVFGLLGPSILSVKFFDKTDPAAALLSTIALFTIGFLQLTFGKGLLAIVLWPYYLGVYIRSLFH